MFDKCKQKMVVMNMIHLVGYPITIYHKCIFISF